MADQPNLIDHQATCAVLQARQDLREKLDANPGDDYLNGAWVEYFGFGDQEVELCDCGAVDRFVAEVDRLSLTYGHNPQAIGMVDGTEDDYGDFLCEAANVLRVDIEDDVAWQDFQERASENRETTMLTWMLRQGKARD